MATDIGETLLCFEIHRQLFLKSFVLEFMVIEEGYICMERNYQYLNKYNLVIAFAIRYNYDVNFIFLFSKVFFAIYYMTNYTIKA